MSPIVPSNFLSLMVENVLFVNKTNLFLIFHKKNVFPAGKGLLITTRKLVFLLCTIQTGQKLKTTIQPINHCLKLQQEIVLLVVLRTSLILMVINALNANYQSIFMFQKRPAKIVKKDNNLMKMKENVMISNLTLLLVYLQQGGLVIINQYMRFWRRENKFLMKIRLQGSINSAQLANHTMMA